MLSYACIQFHWQFIITNSSYWLVSALLRKFDPLLRKEMKMIKTHAFWWKKKKKRKCICKHKVAFFTLSSLHWTVMLEKIKVIRNCQWNILRAQCSFIECKSVYQCTIPRTTKFKNHWWLTKEWHFVFIFKKYESFVVW